MDIKSLLAAFSVIAIWSSNFVAIKVGLSELPPLALLTFRFTFAGLIFLAFVKWPGWRQAIVVSMVGFIMGPLHQGFLYVSLTEVPASFMSVILQSNIIIVTLIGWLFLKESIGWRTWLGIFIGLAGVIILVGVPDMDIAPLGFFYGFASTFFLALNYVGMKKIGTINPVTYIVFLSLPNAPLLFISSLVFEGSTWITEASTLNWGIITIVVLYQAIILSASHILWQKLAVKHPLSQLIPLTLTMPLFTFVIAVLFLDEIITLPILLGGALTIAGVSIITFRKIKKHSL